MLVQTRSVSTREPKNTLMQYTIAIWLQPVGLNPTDDVISSNLGNLLDFTPVTQPPPILVTWPSIYTGLWIWTFAVKQNTNTFKPWSHYLFCLANDVILHVTTWIFSIIFVLFSENKMVEQTRQPSRVVSLQAGPGEVDTGTHWFDVNLRYGAGPNHNNTSMNLRTTAPQTTIWNQFRNKQIKKAVAWRIASV